MIVELASILACAIGVHDARSASCRYGFLPSASLPQSTVAVSAWPGAPPWHDVLIATLVEQDGKRMLMRTAKQRSYLERAQRALRLGSMQALLVEARDRIGGESGPGQVVEDWRQAIDIRRRRLEDRAFAASTVIPAIRTPADVLLDRCLIQLGAQLLADLPLYRPTIFALSPGSGTRALPGFRTHIDELLTAEQLVASSPDLDDEVWRRVARFGATDEDCGQALLTVTPFGSRVFAQVAVYGKSGVLRSLAGRTLTFRAPKFDDPQPVWIQISPDRLRRIRWFAPNAPGMSLASQPGAMPSGDAWWAFEPLEAALGDALAFRAWRERLPVVAVLDDRLFDLALECVSGNRMDVAKLWSRAERLDLLHWRKAKGWLIGSPTDQLTAEQQRLDRTKMQSLIASATKRGSVDLFEFAELWQASGPAMADGVLDDHLLAAAARAGVRLSHVGEWRFLAYQALGATPPAVRQRLQNGEALPLWMLGAEAISRLESWARYQALELEWAPGAQGPDRSLSVVEAAPLGLPRDAAVRLTLTPQTILCGLDGSTALREGLAEEAFRRYLASGVDRATALAGRWSLRRQQKVAFTVSWDRWRLGATSTGTPSPFGPEAPTWGDLPEEVRRWADP